MGRVKGQVDLIQPRKRVLESKPLPLAPITITTTFIQAPSLPGCPISIING